MNLREPYRGGINEYRGQGVVRYCLLCKAHKSIPGGTIKQIAGGRHGICSEHKNA